MTLLKELTVFSILAIFNDDEEQSQKYRSHLKNLTYTNDGSQYHKSTVRRTFQECMELKCTILFIIVEIIPEFYFVPKHVAHLEQLNPKSQTRMWGNRYPRSLFLQGQSLYYILQLLGIVVEQSDLHLILVQCDLCKCFYN